MGSGAQCPVMIQSDVRFARPPCWRFIQASPTISVHYTMKNIPSGLVDLAFGRGDCDWSRVDDDCVYYHQGSTGQSGTVVEGGVTNKFKFQPQMGCPVATKAIFLSHLNGLFDRRDIRVVH